MRIWDVPPARLCRRHLLGEHRELHAIWSILLNGKKGYRSHPETMRWEGKLPALARRHEGLVEEMARRGYRHASPLGGDPDGALVQDEYVDPPDRQLHILREKGCECETDDAVQGISPHKPSQGPV